MFELVDELVKLKLFPVKHCAVLAIEKLATASAFTEINLVIESKHSLLAVTTNFTDVPPNML